MKNMKRIGFICGLLFAVLSVSFVSAAPFVDDHPYGIEKVIGNQELNVNQVAFEIEKNVANDAIQINTLAEMPVFIVSDMSISTAEVTRTDLYIPGSVFLRSWSYNRSNSDKLQLCKGFRNVRPQINSATGLTNYASES